MSRANLPKVTDASQQELTSTNKNDEGSWKEGSGGKAEKKRDTKEVTSDNNYREGGTVPPRNAQNEVKSISLYKKFEGSLKKKDLMSQSDKK